VNRQRALELLRRQPFEVLVIGGGITGAGVALDAASRGLRVALIEKSDFASGTSSRSSKLIHGGLRYLKQLRFGLTLESVRERETLLRMAPHLVRPVRILLPYRRPLAYKAALSLYDAIAGSPAARRHRRIERDEIRRLVPHLRTAGVGGAFQYFDATVDDCRLVMHVLRKATQLGAVVVNYAGFASFTSEGVQVTDSIANESFAVRCTTAVNATGVWSDAVRQKLDDGAPSLLRTSKGAHIVIDAAKLRVDGAVTIPRTSRGHYLFVAPWEGRTIVGTTDTAYEGSLERPLATREDISTLLDGVAEWFPSAGVTPSDVVAVYAGLRPLAASAGATSAASREEFIERRGRLITVAGGKLTTFRHMAKRVVDRLTSAPCETHRLTLDASEEPPRGLEPAVAAHLHRAFGSQAHIIAESAGAGALLDEEQPHTWAEIDYIVRHEMPMTVADILARRTRIALSAHDHGRSVVEAVADRLSEHLGWTPAQRQSSIGQYLEEVLEYSTN